MANVVHIKQGSDTIDFLATGGNYSYQLEDSGITIGNPDEEVIWAPLDEGEVPIETILKNRKVTIRFSIIASTKEYLSDAIDDLDLVLYNVIEYHKKRQVTGRPEFAYQVNTVSHTSYFDLLYGAFLLPPTFYGVEGVHQTTTDGNFIIKKCVLNLICGPKAYRISPATGSPVELALTNSNGTDVTGGLQVENTYESGYDNYVEIDGADLPGNVEIPLIFRMTNPEFTNNPSLGRFIVGLTEYTSLGYADLILEGESPTQIVGYTNSNQSDSEASGGSYKRITVNGPSFATTQYMYWTLNSNTMVGKYRVLVVAFVDSSGNTPPHEEISLRAAVHFADNLVSLETSGGIFYGDPVAADGINCVFDCGEITIPPRLREGSGLQYTRISLQFRKEDTTNRDFDLDYVFLLPVDGGFRVYDATRPAITYGGSVTDDQWEKNVYYGLPGSNTVSSRVLPYFSPINLMPQKDQRLYFLTLQRSGSGWPPSWFSANRGLYLDIEAWAVPAFRHMST